MRILDDTIAPMSKHGTHHVVVEVVLIIRVDDCHDGLLILWVADVWSTMQIPNHITGYLPGRLAAGWLPGTECLGHQVQTVIINQIGGKLLCLGIFAVHEINLDEQLHASLLVHLSYVRHLSLCRNMLNSKLQVFLQHLEDGSLAG